MGIPKLEEDKCESYLCLPVSCESLTASLFDPAEDTALNPAKGFIWIAKVLWKFLLVECPYLNDYALLLTSWSLSKCQ